MQKLLLAFISLLITGCSGQTDINMVTKAVNGEPFIPMMTKPFIAVLPVGQGNCQVMVCPSDNKALIIDCGSTGMSKYGKIKWDPQKTAESIVNLFVTYKIEEYNVALSHADADHYNYINKVILSISNQRADLPENIILGGKLEEYSSKYTADFISFLVDRGFTNMLDVGRGVDIIDQFKCQQDNVTTKMVAGNVGTSSNSKSLVFAINFPDDNNHNRYALLTGDADENTFNKMNSFQSIVYSEVVLLIPPHHGENNKKVAELMNQMHLKPNVLFYSTGADIRYHHPRCKTMETMGSKLDNSNNHCLGCYDDNNVFRRGEITKAAYVTFYDGPLYMTFQGDHLIYNNSTNTCDH
ncbi:hypothetical protein CEG15_15265 [Vibrio anguillarum]|uniref:hypothetical protein n=1 Tax=Vibrio anguillarum TaxID=55601 RepID=UPI000B5422DD|nr:hypothetical protein [Vibrio anguillarum]ASG01530.1 hypothetical protein CEG15_15265 [Vibrio anguillarum]